VDPAIGETVSVLALIAVLAWAVIRPRGWPEAVAAVPAVPAAGFRGQVTVPSDASRPTPTRGGDYGWLPGSPTN
jgi:arsenical pump membrane protein